jgi:hypothetical protein
MTRTPSPQEINAAIHRIRRALIQSTGNRFPVVPKGGGIIRLDEVERKLLEALKRDAGYGPELDGYPSGGSGESRGGGPSILVDTDTGKERIGVTGVEAVAFRRIEHGDSEKDPHHELTEVALARLAEMNHALDGLLAALAEIDKKADTSRHSNDGGTCMICERRVEGTAIDRLRRGMCQADYTAWVRGGRPDVVQFQRVRADKLAS